MWTLNTLIVLWGVSLFAFILTALTPGDLAENLLMSKGTPPTAEMVARTRTQLGLDRPWWVQYWDWLTNLLRGNLGVSFSQGTSISADFAKRFPRTLALTITSLFVSWIIAIPLGLAAASRPNRTVDRLARALSYVTSSLPGFLVALMVLHLFGLHLRWFPISAPPNAVGLVMPVLTLVVTTAGWYTRQIRTIAMEELDKPYVEGLRVRGMGQLRIARHVLRNTAAPLVTLAGTSFGALLAGSAVVEAIFNWQGLGNYALAAITTKDYPVIQAYVVWCAMVFLVSNVLADLAAFALDPRLSDGVLPRRRHTPHLDAPTRPLRIEHQDVAALAQAHSRADGVGSATHGPWIKPIHVWRGLAGFLVLIILAGFGHRLLTPHDPFATNIGENLRPPSGVHLLGTDQLGRDILARVLSGIIPTLSIAVAVVLLSLVIGTLVGIVSAVAGGAVDALLQRITAVFQSFPEFVLALAVAAMLRPGATSAIIALTAAYWPRMARYARILTMQIANAPYVHVARMNRVPQWKLVLQHLAPNIGSPLLVIAAADIGTVILNLATLSFVGLGLPQSTAEWGTMISEGRAYLQAAPWLIIGPGLALFIVTLTCNLWADVSQQVLSVNERFTNPTQGVHK